MARAAIRGEQTLVELSQQFDVHANQIKQWKDQLLEGATGVFGDDAKAKPVGPTVDVKTLHGKIGELTLENDFLSGALGKQALLQHAGTNEGGGIIEARIHLAKRPKLFRQTEPPLFHADREKPWSLSFEFIVLSGDVRFVIE